MGLESTERLGKARDVSEGRVHAIERIGNALADKFARRGALLHGVSRDSLRAVRAIFM